MTNDNYIDVNIPDLTGNEKKYLAECVETGWISSFGPFIERFEKEMAQLAGRKHAVALSNGSDALELAVRALGIGNGDEIIIPDFCIISCSQAVVYNQATPVLVDCHPDTFNMNVNQIESKITERTKAIMVVHTYGFPVDMDPVLELAKKYNLKIIEDAAEMHGQTYKGKPCGSFGDISTFSFYPNKHVTTGEGGMVCVDDDELLKRCQSLRNLCFSPRRFVHDDLGWNMRMSNMQAAIGCAQMERVHDFIKVKRRAGRYYTEKLQDLQDKVQLPITSTDYADNIYWVYPLVLKDTVKVDAIEVMKRFQALGVGTRPFFYSQHKQPCFIKRGLFTGEETDYPVGARISDRGFYIPIGTAITQEQQDRVIEVMKKVFAEL
uniref:Uncharacterized protein n=1 Tax=Percolomonas cosmopolitus TaxID=63605 RepID=A0A7S1KN62_9EUKA